MREFNEETGLSVQPASLEPLAVWQAQDTHSGKTYLMICFHANIANHSTVDSALAALKLQPDEVASGAFLPPNLWPAMLPVQVQESMHKPKEQEIEVSRTVQGVSTASSKDPSANFQYKTAKVNIGTVAKGIGGGHQFALYHLHLRNSMK